MTETVVSDARLEQALIALHTVVEALGNNPEYNVPPLFVHTIQKSVETLRLRATPPAPERKEGEDMSRGWLIHKAGRGWYRPNAQGYTSNTSEAGRYSKEDADAYSHPNGWDGPRDEITIKHESELPASPVPLPVTPDTMERLVAQAYLRGIEWRDENPGYVDFSYRFKAANDYSDKVASALSKPGEQFECPINQPGCTKDCGSYACGN